MSILENKKVLFVIFAIFVIWLGYWLSGIHKQNLGAATLTKVNLIGTGYYEVTKDKDGKIIEKEITAKQYSDLAKPGAKATNAYARPKFDTVDGRLGDGQFYEDKDGTVIKLAGQDEIHLDKNKPTDSITKSLDTVQINDATKLLKANVE